MCVCMYVCKLKLGLTLTNDEPISQILFFYIESVNFNLFQHLLMFKTDRFSTQVPPFTFIYILHIKNSLFK